MASGPRRHEVPGVTVRCDRASPPRHSGLSHLSHNRAFRHPSMRTGNRPTAARGTCTWHVPPPSRPSFRPSAYWRPPAEAPRPRRPDPAPVAPAIAIVGATLWDGTGRAPVPNAVTLVQRDRILCAGAAGECVIPARSRIIDAQGQYLIPGLIDSHVHLLFLTEGSAGEELGLDLRDLLAQGVTTLRDMGTDPAGLLSRVRALQAAPRVHAMQLVAGRRFFFNGFRGTVTPRGTIYHQPPAIAMQQLGWTAAPVRPRATTRTRSWPRRARPARWVSSSTRSSIPARSGSWPMPRTAPACRSGATRGFSRPA